MAAVTTTNHHIPIGSVREFLRAAEARGWVVTRRTRHYRITHPSGGWVCVPCSPSDVRCLKNTAAQVRRVERAAA